MYHKEKLAYFKSLENRKRKVLFYLQSTFCLDYFCFFILAHHHLLLILLKNDQIMTQGNCFTCCARKPCYLSHSKLFSLSKQENFAAAQRGTLCYLFTGKLCQLSHRKAVHHHSLIFFHLSHRETLLIITQGKLFTYHTGKLYLISTQGKVFTYHTEKLIMRNF